MSLCTERRDIVITNQNSEPNMAESKFLGVSYPDNISGAQKKCRIGGIISAGDYVIDLRFIT